MRTPLRVLIVEDNDDDAQLVLVRLRRAGYDPDYVRVDSEDSLLKALQRLDWQIVISDYAMPGFSGLEALHILRKYDPNIPFILVSGTVGEETAVEAMRTGANDYIIKDNLTRLVPAIERELRKSLDLADHRRAEEALYQERERALVTLHSIGDGVITTDAEGRVDYMNPVAETVTAWTHEEAQGYPLTEILPLIDETTRHRIESPADISLRSGQGATHTEQCVLINRNGQEFNIENSAAPIFDRDNNIIGAVLVFHDVTRERRMAHQMTWQATHDILTGLANRNEFSDRLANLLAIKGDAGNPAHLKKCFGKHKIDAVMHFAAYAYVGESVEDPLKYYENNLRNTLQLLHTLMENDVKYVVFSSTCATYGNPENIPIDEDHPQNPINPYGRSKRMIEEILADYHAAYGLKYMSLRYFNAAGADPDAEVGEDHDPETHLIPLVLDVAAARRASIKVFGTDYETPDGTCIRDYIHILDLAQAHIIYEPFYILACIFAESKTLQIHGKMLEC